MPYDNPSDLDLEKISDDSCPPTHTSSLCPTAPTTQCDAAEPHSRSHVSQENTSSYHPSSLPPSGSRASSMNRESSTSRQSVGQAREISPAYEMPPTPELIKLDNLARKKEMKTKRQEYEMPPTPELIRQDNLTRSRHPPSMKPLPESLTEPLNSNAKRRKLSQDNDSELRRQTFLSSSSDDMQSHSTSKSSGPSYTSHPPPTSIGEKGNHLLLTQPLPHPQTESESLKNIPFPHPTNRDNHKVDKDLAKLDDEYGNPPFQVTKSSEDEDDTKVAETREARLPYAQLASERLNRELDEGEEGNEGDDEGEEDEEEEKDTELIWDVLRRKREREREIEEDGEEGELNEEEEEEEVQN